MSKLAYHRSAGCETISCLCRLAILDCDPIFIAQSPSDEQEFLAESVSITSIHGARIRSAEVVPCIDFEYAICIIFFLHIPTG
jgi:hypothetical protein